MSLKSRVKARIGIRLGTLRQHAAQPFRWLLPAEDEWLGESSSFAIAMPVLNQARFVAAAVRSVLDQDYPRLAFGIKDGLSTDGSAEVLAAHVDRLAFLQSGRDGGQAAAINAVFAALPAADLMGWLNGDDLLAPGTLRYVAGFFEAHPRVDVVYGHRLLIDEQGRSIGRWIMPAHSDAILSWNDYIPQETLFWRRRIWDASGAALDQRYRFALDWDLLVRFREAGARFVRLPRVMGAFRVHPEQLTSSRMDTLGLAEMHDIRTRCHGGPVGRLSVALNTGPYLLQHVLADRRFARAHGLDQRGR